VLSDLRFALRQFARSPGFTATVVLSLALGIAANATVLCWLQRFVLQPLSGVSTQQELVVLVSNQGSGCMSLPDLRDFASDRSIFSGAFGAMPTAACLTVDRHPEWIQAQVVTANFFDVLGAKPLLGRTFLPGEDQKPGGDPVVVISERLWRKRFQAAPDIVGRVVDLNRKSFTVIGVVSREFDGSLPPSRFDLWAPASMIWEVRNQDRYFLTSRTARGWHNLARLQPGVSLPQAQAAVAITGARLAATYPDTNREAQHRVVPLTECPWGSQTVVGPALKLLLVVSLGVQLIVTANVANLMLARAMDRRREIAIRMSAGASRQRIVRQMLTESLLLALAGGVLGILASVWTVDAITLLLPKEIVAQASLSLRLDVTTVGLAVALAIATGVIFGIAPALHAAGGELTESLKQGGRGSAGSSHHRLRRVLVVAEVALALVLLVGAALCVKGLRQARQIDLGFKPDGVLLANLQIGMNGYDRTSGPAYYRELRQRAASAPGVEEAALASWFPLGLAGCKRWGVEAEGYERPRGEDTNYEYAIVSPRYFATLQIPLVTGRDFTDADDRTSLPVVIVNEHFARKFWPNQEAVGRRIRVGGVWRTIVGVAKAGKYNRLDERPWCFFYLPYQQGVPDLDLALCVRTAGDPAIAASLVRSTVAGLDPGVEVQRTVSLAAYSSMVLFPQRMASALLLLLGAVALTLAAMGVYAVMAYAVSQRTREFGVRLALGAAPHDLVRHVVGQGVALATVGIAAGLVLALAAARLMRGFLYGVSPFDPDTFVVVSLALALTAALACLLPARRVMRVDPIEALRAD
jgi:predicted permease